MKLSLSFTCVHVTAIDASGTESAYAEMVNRKGIDIEDIGQAVINAFARLAEKTKGDEEAGDQVLMHFSYDT